MAGFYHVYIRTANFVPDDAQRALIESSLNLAKDWYRYDPNNYIIYTSKDAKIWTQRLMRWIKEGGFLLVCRIDPTDKNGWMPKTFWDWMSKLKEKD